MKIRVKGFLNLRKVMGDQAAAEFEVDAMTLLEFLHQLANTYGRQFAEMVFDDEAGMLNRHIRFLVNGRHFSHLPQKLNTPLCDGDNVDLFPPVAGG